MEKDILVPVLFAAGVLTVIGIIFRLGAAVGRKAQANVRALADCVGLQVIERPTRFGLLAHPEATGTIRQKAVRLYNYTTGSGKSRTTWSALAVTPRAHGGPTFALTAEGIASRFMEFFGAKEVKVDDPAFDAHWFVRSNAPEYFGAALLPEICARLGRPRGTWKLQDGVVTYLERGLFSDAARCERFAAAVPAACDLADIAEVYAQQT
ncbi:MAG: hypothetical protein ACO3DQ_04560 [Cephaloticoccus sp.]